jgi:hypothetical protein
MAPEDIKKIALITKTRLYDWTVMPFGLKNATCRNPSFGLATKAKGIARVWAKGKPGSSAKRKPGS